MRPRRRRIEEATLQLCADLVRHLHASNRTYSQAALARLVSLIPQRPVVDAPDAVELLGHVLSRILDELSPRQRQILVRCDVHGQNATAVAASLSISRRQLYRERRSALGRVAERLVVSSQVSIAPAIAVRNDGLADRIAVSRTLENGGHWRAAADVLERLAEELDGPDERSNIEIQLAYLYLRADRLSMARERAEIARQLADRVNAGREWREAEANAVAANIAFGAWDFRTADHLAHRSIAQLESWASGTQEARVHNALANGLLVKSFVAMGQGALESSRTLANRACDIMENNERLDKRIRILAETSAAVMEVCTGRPFHEAELRLKECYRQALLFGLTNDALGVASHLAGMYRLHGRPRDAVDLLSTLTETTKLGAWHERARVVYEFSNACIEVGDLSAARVMVAELSEMVVGNASRQGPAQLTLARFYAAVGTWGPALAAAEAAETSFVQLGLERWAGEALTLQIQALTGLGEFARAARVAKAAIGLIERSTSALRLETAYKIIGQIPGYAKYAIRARKLRSNKQSRL